MIRKALLLIVLLASCAFVLFSCGARADFFAGRAYSPDELQTLLASARETEDQNADTTVEPTYYFVEGGGVVYHSNPHCSYLKNSTGVLPGTLSEALAVGKERLCTACAKTQTDISQSDEAPNERGCYYTPGGTVWHYDASCVTLAYSEIVHSATVAQAQLDGKTRPCTRCGG